MQARALYVRRRRWLLLAAAVFLIADLQSFPIVLWDESRLAVNALEMRRTGLSLITTYGFRPDLWNTKPPLAIWLMSGAVRVLGAHAWVLRLPSALATLGAAGVVMAFAWRLTRKPSVPLTAAFLLLTSRGFVGRHTGQTADYDALLCFFVTAYAYALFIAVHQRRPRLRLVAGAGLLVAGAVLTKGVAGLIPGVGVAAYLVLQGRWRRPLQSPAYVLGGLLAAGLIAGFYLLREGAAAGYLRAVWTNEIGRYGVIPKDHLHPVWYYLVLVFAAAGFSLGPLALPLLVQVRRLTGRRRAGALFCLCMAGGVIAVYSLGATKIRWYAAPAYPFLAIACALGLEALPRRWRPQPVLWLVAVVLGLTVVAVRDLYPRLHGERASARYGEVFARLHRRGVGRVAVLDDGAPNEAGFPAYAPQLDAYALIWRERGLSVQRPASHDAAASAPGEVVASCDARRFADLAARGPALFSLPGCVVVRTAPQRLALPR